MVGGTSVVAMAAATMGDQQMQRDPPDMAMIQDQLNGIIDRLDGQAKEQVRLKSPIEKRWLRNLRQFHGKYEPKIEAELVEKKQSRAFVKITRKKTNAWKGRLESLIFPTDDRNYEIKPTPVPSLTQASKQVVEQAMAILQQANQQQLAADQAQAQGDQQGADQMAQAAGGIAMQADKMAQQASELAAEIKEAKKRAEAMQAEMDDQLGECAYAEQGRDAIHDFCQLGTAVIKGPMVSMNGRGSWQQGDDGQYGYQNSPDPRPRFRRVNPWSYFPDMSAVTAEDREFDYERHLWSKADLRRMVKRAGFNPDGVRRLINGFQERFLTDVGMEYLAELRELTGTTETLKNRFIGWEYHGPLECKEIVAMLHAMGQHADAFAYEANEDPLVEMMVIAYFCNGELLKIAPEYPLDSQESLYSVVPFERSDASMFGYGVPEIMESSQAALNAAWRMAMDNAGLSVGPQIVIDKDAITPANGIWSITPRKLWYRNKAAGANAVPFEAFDIPNNVSEILAIVKVAREFSDDETALPVQSEGETTENPNVTATASNIMAMGFNVTFRSVVKAWDDGMTVPCMRRLYDWNMQFSKRDDIKGDMSVDARGSSVLLVREVQSQVMMAVVTNHTVHPTLALMIDPYEAYKKFLQSMMVPPDEIMVTKDEWKEKVDNAAKQQQQSPDEITAQARIQVAQIQQQTRADSDKAMLAAEDKRHDTAMIQLAEQRNMQLEELQTLLSGKQMDNDTKERLAAAEMGLEQQNADKVEAMGQTPTGSGGYVSLGAEPPK